MGAPAEVLQEIFTVIEGGQSIGQSAEVIQFPSDNGLRTFTAVNKTFQGSNGTGLNYWVAAVAEGASAVSAGALFIVTSIPEFIAFAVPCLGIAVGTAFYSIDPEGWTNLARLLSDAGWTVKNKVVAFMREEGIIAYPPETIEILKNELIRLGAFDFGNDWEGDKPESFEIVEPVVSSTKMYSCIMDDGGGNFHYEDVYYGCAYADNSGARLGCIKVPEGLYFDYKVTSYLTETGATVIFSSKQDYGAINGYILDAVTMDYRGFITGGSAQSYTYDNKTVYYTAYNFSSSYISSFESLGTNPENSSSQAQLAWILQYGSFEDNNSEKYQQKNAIFPAEGVPFRTTYPDWLPWEFPELPGWQIPEVMPVAYPKSLPAESEPYQKEAQDPEGDEETADEGVQKLEDPESNPEIDNTQEVPDEDPETGEEGEEITNPTDEDKTSPDPIDPDPPTPITPAIPAPSLPTSVSSNKLFSVYNPTATQLGQLGRYLWDNDLIDILRKIWQNPLDGIISLIQVYATPVTSGSSNIILGYLDSGVSAAVVSNQFVTIDCGSIVIDEQSENCLDYIPYTKLELYLPFIGVTEIDTNEFMAGTISVKYKVDVYTGTCLAEVKCTRTRDLANGTILYTFSGNCSQQIPLTSGDARGVLGALISAAGLGLSIASGGAAGLLQSGARIAGGLASMTSQEMLHVSHSGNLSANAGIMGQKKPYLIINRKRAYTANSYNRYYGYPANKTISPGNHSGFLRLKAGRLQSAATEQEKNEIYELLSRGVIM